MVFLKYTLFYFNFHRYVYRETAFLFLKMCPHKWMIKIVMLFVRLLFFRKWGAYQCMCIRVHTHGCAQISVWKKGNVYKKRKFLERFMLCPIVVQQFCGNLVITGSQQLYVVYLLDIGRNGCLHFSCALFIPSAKLIRKQIIFPIILLLIQLLIHRASSKNSFQKF